MDQRFKAVIVMSAWRKCIMRSSSVNVSSIGKIFVDN